MTKQAEKSRTGGEHFRSGTVALVGRPNVGKSTLVNTWVGDKISIVTSKAQTTRTLIRGIVHRDDVQIVFVDTPGLCEPGTPLHRAMRRMAASSANDADVVVVVTQISEKVAPIVHPKDKEAVQVARSGGAKVLLVINKVDRIRDKGVLLPWIQMYTDELQLQEAIFPVSAKKQDGIDRLLDAIAEYLPEGPALFPEEMYTDQMERALCEELIREQLLLQTHQEVPHGVAVVIEQFEDGRDEKGGGLCRLEGRIYVERDSQKGIVVGKKGSKIRALSESARQGIEELLGCKVYLRLTVHVDRDWTRSERGVRRYGLDGVGEV